MTFLQRYQHSNRPNKQCPRSSTCYWRRKITQCVSQLSKGSMLNIWLISVWNNGFTCTWTSCSTASTSSLPGLCLDRPDLQITSIEQKSKINDRTLFMRVLRQPKKQLMQMQCKTLLTGNIADLDLKGVNVLTGEFVSAATENRSQQGDRGKQWLADAATRHQIEPHPAQCVQRRQLTTQI